jgi:hypothetical protein
VWWKIEGSIMFKELSVAANFLVKLTHNGFQECVFSRGVYLDGKLRKCLKEDDFEMSVFSCFNKKWVAIIKETIRKKDTKEYTVWMMDKKSKKK